MAEEEFDNITEDPDSQVEDDEMSAAEAGFALGAEDEDDEYSGKPKKKKRSPDDEDYFDEDEVR